LYFGFKDWWVGDIASFHSQEATNMNIQALVTDRVKAIMQTAGNPKSPEEAVKYVEQAYGEINQRLGSLAGRNTPSRMPTSYNSSSSGNSAPQPRTLKEAVSWAALRGGSAR
jgi:hypothetical protein